MEKHIELNVTYDFDLKNSVAIYDSITIQCNQAGINLVANSLRESRSICLTHAEWMLVFEAVNQYKEITDASASK